MSGDSEGDEARRDSRGFYQEPLYTTQLSQLFLCGTSSWAVNRIPYELNPIAFGTFTFLLGHGLLGLLKYTTSEANKDKLRPAFRYSTFLTRVLPVPLITTQIYLHYEEPEMIAYSHAASIIVPTSVYVLKRDLTNPFVLLLILSNAGSLAYISIMNENYWTLGLSAIGLINEFGMDFLCDTLAVPPVDLWTTSLGFLVIFTIKALETV